MSLPDGLSDGTADNGVQCFIYEHLLADGRGVQLNGPINGPTLTLITDFNMPPDYTYESKRKREEETKHELFRELSRHNLAKEESSIPEPVEDTYQWILRHPKYSKWSSEKRPLLLWINGTAEIGKSGISKSIIRDLSFSDPQHQRSGKPQNMPLVSGGLFSNRNEARLWKILNSSMAYLPHGNVYFVIDAVHEYSGDIIKLYDRIEALASAIDHGNCKVLLTSRPSTLRDRVQSNCDIINLNSPDGEYAISSDTSNFTPTISKCSTINTPQTVIIPIDKSQI
ncbi:unnamed protein product [Clonostachys rosea]|uniref:Nephrocystin 3-like N-terminal domain-containing protein n=1 Tax=Bionectria ochroleuca TaxID=29856 RepID=A0ABY6UYI6_BIOOC|nr:unnamed protein product [Clonostachys rosea]